ncbi:hypothetical protein M413DRAFT_9956 [Hebeloma cylindrosporum]|uniref:DUF3669 domain-containing protein n=1 Tax=Hebeloma cylindrosporum TaxID=76867 RepID=A0A0C3CI00_HEBCY|nr:hypothetical protein M413DRAFT_9956 [Hebeloma cylindrosporum h7]
MLQYTRLFPPSLSPSNIIRPQNNNRPIEFVRIGSGTFATVYMNTADPGVYKKCRSAQNSSVLAEEYRQIKLISATLQESGNAILSPTPIEFYGPTLVFPAGDVTRTCAYSMTRVYPLPSALKAKLIKKYCPLDIRQNVKDLGLVLRGYHLARLLLGRPEPTADRDDQREMGRMLAQLHMTARNDARDIEVVCGANITNSVPTRLERRETRFWVIDFNQVKEFNFTEAQIPLLVDGFYANEAYFPRARPTEL